MAKRYFRCDYSKYQSEPCDNAVCIPMTRGWHTIIDAEDYDKVKDYTWFSVFKRKMPYAQAHFMDRIYLRMHRVILVAEPNMQVDHINRNKLDNRKSNLRLCTASQNASNQDKRASGKTSKYIGVCFYKKTSTWVAKIKANGVIYRLGTFYDEHEAARAYNDAAIKYHKEFASLNIIEELK